MLETRNPFVEHTLIYRENKSGINENTAKPIIGGDAKSSPQKLSCLEIFPFFVLFFIISSFSMYSLSKFR